MLFLALITVLVSLWRSVTTSQFPQCQNARRGPTISRLLQPLLVKNPISIPQ
ncbi:unnamed protein product, partial [Staurois parvus]